MAENLRIRKDVETLSNAEMDMLVKAFNHICYDLEPTDPNSFYQIAGYHGMPFRGAGWANNSWWGGYCNHGNILFPTWHRAYLQRLEDALRTAPGCSDLALPYWNELKTQTTPTDGRSYIGVPPPIFLQEDWVYLEDPDLKGKSIKNPLFSYKLKKSIVDNTSPDNADTHGNYTKLKGYETVRYPFSGLMGVGDVKETEKHNAEIRAKGKGYADKELCENVLVWLNMQTFDNGEGKPIQAGVGKDFEACLRAPNYTVFSNTTSAKAWNDDHMDDLGFVKVVPLEAPHNKIHLAVGGFGIPGQGDYNVIEGANGDMGENNTASFDPIFFFHHCFIDLMFWRWQKEKHATDKLDIKYQEDVTPDYPGTNSVDSQGPTPGVMANATLTLDSPLAPFKKQDPATGQEVSKTSRDVTNIQKMGYDYAYIERPSLTAGEPEPILRVWGANRSAIRGSFVISTWAKLKDGREAFLDAEAFLSRWNVGGCANCQSHLDAGTHVSAPSLTSKELQDATFFSKLHTRDDMKGEKSENPVLFQHRLGKNIQGTGEE